LLHSSDTGKKWDNNEIVYQLFIDFRKACDSVRREQYSHNVVVVVVVVVVVIIIIFN
jgi:hypothetical protein